MLFAVSEGYASGVEVRKIESFERHLYEYFEQNCKDLVETLKTGNKMSKETVNAVRQALESFAGGI